MGYISDVFRERAVKGGCRQALACNSGRVVSFPCPGPGVVAGGTVAGGSSSAFDFRQNKVLFFSALGALIDPKSKTAINRHRDRPAAGNAKGGIVLHILGLMVALGFFFGEHCCMLLLAKIPLAVSGYDMARMAFSGFSMGRQNTRKRRISATSCR
jgi:hypothetical protein